MINAPSTAGEYTYSAVVNAWVLTAEIDSDPDAETTSTSELSIISYPQADISSFRRVDVIPPMNVESPPKTDPMVVSFAEVARDTYGVAQKQQRASEDRYQVKQIGPFRYFVVFDGHGGPHRMDSRHVGDYCVEHLHEDLFRALENVDLACEMVVISSLVQTFVQFDIKLEALGLKFGSTCTMILIDDIREKIYQVNLGDSRSIIFNENTIVSATVDHEPNSKVEKDRIYAAGGVVINNRITGMIAVSRSFGDFDAKITKVSTYDPINGMMSAIPDVIIIPKSDATHIILTSDAPYDRDQHSNQDLV